MFEELSAMTKRELLDLARERSITGRSKMKKAELTEALLEAGFKGEGDPVSPEDPAGAQTPCFDDESRVEPKTRREVLYRRLGDFVDTSVHCEWWSIEGHPCGLPTLTGTPRCALHGDGIIADRAIPLTGRLGFGTWPPLLRQLSLATYDIDAFGLDPVVAEMAWHLLNFLYFDYFHVEVEGIENVPMDGAALLVANHGGSVLPYDAAMLSLAVMNEAEIPRRVRVVGTEIFNMLPVVSHLYRKVGAAYAAKDDARELLKRGHLLAVFPEGEQGFMKPAWDAYRVGRLGRGGFAQLAEEASVPIIPVAIVGSEEVHPAFTVSKRLAQLVRIFFPEQRVEEIAIVLNPLPLPVRWRLRFLPPVLPSTPDQHLDALDQLERAEDIRRTIQEGLDNILSNRRTAF